MAYTSCDANTKSNAGIWGKVFVKKRKSHYFTLAQACQASMIIICILQLEQMEVSSCSDHVKSHTGEQALLNPGLQTLHSIKHGLSKTTVGKDPPKTMWPAIFNRRAARMFKTCTTWLFSQGTELLSLRLSNKKLTTANTTIAIRSEWIQITPLSFCQMGKK